MIEKLAAAAKQFIEWRSQLPDAALKEADELAAGILDCRTASAEKIWGKMWDKPIYSSRNVDAAKRMVRDAAPHMEGKWQTAGMGSFAISKIPKHERPEGHWTDHDGFRGVGPFVKQLHGYGISYYRSYAIACAGMRLRELAALKTHPFSDLHNKKLRSSVITLGKELGDGWGHVTVLHFLTDLGLACKPDLHVVRTMSALGLITCKKAQPTLKEAIEVNRLVSELLPLAYSGSKVGDLRRLDKVLMEISRVRLLPKAIYEHYPDKKDTDRSPEK